MRNACVFFEINEKKFGLEAKDILHIEPAVAVVKDPGASESILGYVNLGGIFGPVYDLGQILRQNQPAESIKPEHYFLLFTNHENKIAAFRLLDIPSFENCEIIEFDSTTTKTKMRVARLKEDMVILLSPESFLESQGLERKIQQLITEFSNDIQNHNETLFAESG